MTSLHRIRPIASQPGSRLSQPSQWAFVQRGNSARRPQPVASALSHEALLQHLQHEQRTHDATFQARKEQLGILRQSVSRDAFSEELLKYSSRDAALSMARAKAKGALVEGISPTVKAGAQQRARSKVPFMARWLEKVALPPGLLSFREPLAGCWELLDESVAGRSAGAVSESRRSNQQVTSGMRYIDGLSAESYAGDGCQVHALSLTFSGLYRNDAGRLHSTFALTDRAAQSLTLMAEGKYTIVADEWVRIGFEQLTLEHASGSHPRETSHCQDNEQYVQLKHLDENSMMLKTHGPAKLWLRADFIPPLNRPQAPKSWLERLASGRFSKDAPADRPTRGWDGRDLDPYI